MLYVVALADERWALHARIWPTLQNIEPNLLLVIPRR